MKKRILILLSILCFSMITQVKAENYDKFQIYTTFEGIDQSQISEVYVNFEVYGEDELREVTLNVDNAFKYTSTEIPKGNILFDSGYVKDDKLGNYDVVGTVTQNGEDEIYINIVVKNFEATTMTTTKTTLTTSTSTAIDEEENVDEEENNGMSSIIAIAIISLLAGVILVGVLIFAMKAIRSSNFY